MLLALALAMTFPQNDPVPGIARDLARERAALLRDVEYDLQFKIVPKANAVAGTATIRFVLPAEAAPTGPLVLDFGGEALTDVHVNARAVAPRAVHDHVLLPAESLVRGGNVVTATFRSKVAATGTPLTVYTDATDGREYWYTLVVPADAHRLYPCFDQPDVKARFTFTLELPDDWTAVANTARVPVDADVRGSTGTVWRFAPSKPLP
ncbi:MAG: hypothetical protein JNK15_26025, partial [Planctomycetes bacterium]|nr:hypothetical protein [Planctomycetota bacterium]